MDVETRSAFWADMRRSAAEGRTILFATHYLEEADNVADRIIVLDHGRIVADGTGRSIKSRVGGRTIRFDMTGADQARLAALPGVDGRRDPRRHGPIGDYGCRRHGPCAARARTAVPRPGDHQPRPRGGFPRPHLDEHTDRRSPTDDHAYATSTRWTASAGPFGAFVSLEIRRALRNRRYVMLAIAIPVVFYLLYTGVLAGDTADPNAQVDGLAWRTYFMISMAAYAAIGAALGGAIVIAGERQSGWTRQLRVTPLPPVAYIAGKLLVSYIVTVPAIAAVLLAGVAVDHVTMSITGVAPAARSARHRSAAVRRARPAHRLPLRRQQRAGRNDDQPLRPGDPRRSLGADLVVPGRSGYHRTHAPVIPPRGHRA